MTPEEAYEIALRRIREAEETGALELYLTELTRLPPELERLTSLQSLDLAGCSQLSGDLSPLASLTSLQELSLRWCCRLRGDLNPLASESFWTGSPAILAEFDGTRLYEHADPRHSRATI